MLINPDKTIIEFRGLRKRFGERNLYGSLNFKINEGSRIGFSGPSGSGKSTILNLIAGFSQPDEGRVLIDSRDATPEAFRALRRHTAWLPQNSLALSCGSVRETILRPFSFAANRANRPGEDDILAALELFNLRSDALTKDFAQLSGGERQRVGLAICLLLKKRLLLLDEPTAALDRENAARFREVFLKGGEFAVALAAHEPESLEMCDEVIEVADARD